MNSHATRVGYNRQVRHVLILAVSLLLFSGCPDNAATPVENPLPAADEFSAFGRLMRDQTGFNDELKRLQALYTDPPSTSYATAGNNHNRYDIGSRIEPDGVGITLTERETDEAWVLWAWRDESAEPAAVTVLRDEQQGGGYVLEYNLAHDVLTVTITARWVQGRYLQVSRELMLGGLDHELWVPRELTSWQLSGAWLPYRMLPSATGPYGVVPDGRADGEWHTLNYPQSVMVPALAAYDREHGFMLAVIDDHARKADRDYQLGWRVPPAREGGAQTGLTYRVYDPTQDRFGEAFLYSGLPVRDVIALEPFTIYNESTDPTLVYSETAEVITRLGALSRAFHFVPKPPAQGDPGSSIQLSEWLDDATDLQDFQRITTGIWGVNCAEMHFDDDALSVGSTVGLGARELPGGTGLSDDVLGLLERIDETYLPVFAYVDYTVFRNGDAYHEAYPDWLARDTDGGYFNKPKHYPNNCQLDIRNPDVAAWLPRKMAQDITGYQQVAGYRFDTLFGLDVREQSAEQGTYAVSYPAAGCALYLRTAEAIAGARPAAKLAANKGLRLCLPAFCTGYGNGDGNFGIGFGSDAPPPPIPHANRLSNMVYSQVFGVNPRIGFGGTSIAAQVIATTPGVHGHGILKSMEQHAGFDAFATHQRELRESGGELMIAHSSPALATYTSTGERPAVCDELIAVLPADWQSARSVWVAFHGIGGSVSVDTSNMLRIAWDGGQWQQKLPAGYWVIEHPAPQDVQPGDAVLIIKRPISKPTGSDVSPG